MKYFSLYTLLIVYALTIPTSTLNANGNYKESYLKEIPFSYTYGVPIIKATIQGNEYNFLFDTGMPTALSKKLSKQLNLNNTRTTQGMDVNGNSSQESYVLLEEILVGGISFKHIESLAVDLDKGVEIGCLKLDGIIGNNIIKDAFWEIDYEKNMIRLSDNIENFNIPKNASIVKFKTKSKYDIYSPNVDISINNKKRKGVKFDTGSNNGISLPLAYFSDKLDANKSVEYYGITSAALYGKGKNKTYVDSKVNSLKIGDLVLENEIVTFDQNYPLVGNKFIQNFKVIIDYSESKIYLIRIKQKAIATLTNFGFQLGIDNKKAKVTSVYKTSDAERKGLQLGDEILSANGINFPQLISDDACNFLLNNPIKKAENITLTIQRDDEEKTFQLLKETFIH